VWSKRDLFMIKKSVTSEKISERLEAEVMPEAHPCACSRRCREPGNERRG
jgi:hypothetical protein